MKNPFKMNPLFSLEEKAFIKKAGVVLSVLFVMGLILTMMLAFCKMYFAIKAVAWLYAFVLFFFAYIWGNRRTHSITKRRDKYTKTSILLDFVAFIAIGMFYVATCYGFYKIVYLFVSGAFFGLNL